MEKELFDLAPMPVQKPQTCKPCRKSALIVIIVFLTVLVIIGVVLSIDYGTKQGSCMKRSLEADNKLKICDYHKANFDKYILNLADETIIGYWRFGDKAKITTTVNNDLAYYLNLRGNSIKIVSYKKSEPSVSPVTIFESNIVSQKIEPSGTQEPKFLYTVVLEKPVNFANVIPELQTTALKFDITIAALAPTMGLISDKMPAGKFISMYKKFPQGTY